MGKYRAALLPVAMSAGGPARVCERGWRRITAGNFFEFVAHKPATFCVGETISEKAILIIK